MLGALFGKSTLLHLEVFVWDTFFFIIYRFYYQSNEEVTLRSVKKNTAASAMTMVNPTSMTCNSEVRLEEVGARFFTRPEPGNMPNHRRLTYPMMPKCQTKSTLSFEAFRGFTGSLCKLRFNAKNSFLPISFDCAGGFRQNSSLKF